MKKLLSIGLGVVAFVLAVVLFLFLIISRVDLDAIRITFYSDCTDEQEEAVIDKFDFVMKDDADHQYTVVFRQMSEEDLLDVIRFAEEQEPVKAVKEVKITPTILRRIK